MQDAPDKELLRQYVHRNSDAAFAALVARYVNLVYSAALRKTGDPGAAEEITQAVFIILARKAESLPERTILSGWLYQTARLTAANFLRTETRRARREQEAYMQSPANETDAEAWPQIMPLLDDAMGQLGEKDRNAISLRFFEGKSFQEIGAAFGASENAAKKRVHYALEKLRRYFSKRGVGLTTGAIAGAMAANSVQAAPVALARTATATATALAKGAAVGGSTLALAKGVLKIMAWTKATTAIVGIVVAGMAAYSVMEHQAQIKLRGENELLQQQMAELQGENERLSAKPAQDLKLPAPQVQMATAAALPAEDLPSTNLYNRLKDKNPKLTRDQVEAYLQANGRNANSLLAAFRTSGDATLLAEAMQKYPHDPQVAFEAAFDKDLPPAEQRQWLDAFEKSAPDNAMANYLSALNYFNAGQTDQGVHELVASAGKPLEDYTVNRVQDDVEAYLAAGYSVAEAKQMAAMQLLLPQLGQLKQLGLDTLDLANAYRQAGDANSAQAALQTVVNMGQQYANPAPGEAEISQLVGLALERMALGAMDPNAPYGTTGQTVRDQLNQIAQQKAGLDSLNQQLEPLMPTLSDEDWIVYKDRWLMFGEENAVRWVINKHGQQ